MKLQKRLAAEVLGVPANRIRLDSDKASEIKEAITKFDIRGLINQGVIRRVHVRGTSRVRARKIAVQKRKGRRRGYGSRKGKHNARGNEKRIWINNVRAQRDVLKRVRDKGLISTLDYRRVYAKVKGGFFRSVQHMKMFMEDKELFKNVKK